jgi:UDP:flavonoid glycosyltransferase YjiC (YdhE family)
MLESDPRVQISARCNEAVAALRGRYGVADATPFCYVTSLSPDLNVYCEPPAFLDDADRKHFEPVAFYGSLPPDLDRTGESPFPAAHLKVYVSFGTITGRYWGREIVDAMTRLSDTFASMDGVQAIFSLAGFQTDPAPLTKRNVTVADFVDQWNVLAHADLFVTHHGLNSTHEAIYHRVPMLSRPFFWDQPALADTCRRFGFALRLDEGDVDRTMSQFERRRPAMIAAIEEARLWELDTIAKRPAVVERIIALRVRGGSSRTSSK